MPERGPNPDSDDPERTASFHPRGLYDADDVAADRDEDALAVVCGYYDFSAHIRGVRTAVGGVAAVASPPEARRKGHVAELLAELHRELRDDGVAFAALWPFEYPFYRRIGYERICEYARLEVDPAALASACPEPAGSYERLDADDWSRLDAVYDQWGPDEFRLDRREDWWRRQVFRSWDTDPYVYGWTDGDRGDDLRGYLVYTIEDAADSDGKSMAVSEFAHADREARGHLLRFCRNHDSQVERVRFTGPSTTRLFDELDNPRAVETTVAPGPMARVVDVEHALEAIEYPADAAVSLTLDVTDDACEWNDDTIRVCVADGRGTVERVSGAAADASLDIGALSRLAVGSHGVDRLVELGDLTVSGADVRNSLAAAFPTTDPFLRENF